MLSELAFILADFTKPLDIGTTPASLLWMFPLLASIAVVYKATKLRVLFWGKFLKEVGILFLTISIFMILTGVALNVLVWLITG
jgi:hypothetical protein